MVYSSVYITFLIFNYSTTRPNGDEIYIFGLKIGNYPLSIYVVDFSTNTNYS